MAPDIAPPWIFLSYRRSNGGFHLAARVRTALERISGPNSVFVDSSGIGAGAEWNKTILEQLKNCLTTVVLIDPTWSSEQLHNPDDWVRREIEESMREGKFVLPLLVDGGNMPSEHVLPESIRAFAGRQGYFVDSRSDIPFAAAMQALGEEFLSKFSSTIELIRDASWPHREVRNILGLSVDGKSSILLVDFSDKQGVTRVTPGVHKLSANWDEKNKDSMVGTKYASYGFYSEGETPPLPVHFRPGLYSFSVRKNSRPRPTGFWASLFDNGDPWDHSRRSLELMSFAPAKASE